MAELMDRAISLSQELRALAEQLSAKQDDPVLIEKRAQLKAIGDVTARLDRAGVTIPDELRHLKGQLLAESSSLDEAQQVTDYLRAQLPLISQVLGLTTVRRERKAPLRRERDDATPTDVIRSWIVDALRDLGGSAPATQVRLWLAEHRSADFLPGDLEPSTRGTLRWVERLHLVRLKMVREGQLRDDSPRETWELP